MASQGVFTCSIHEQNISGDARVYNAPIYNMIRRESILEKHEIEIQLWLSPLRMSERHNKIRNQASIEESNRLEPREDSRAGNWFIESEVYDDWQGRQYKKLWCYGMPGAGKSVIASIVITHLLKYQARFNQTINKTRVAYLYLSYQETYTVAELLGCIVKQLIGNDKLFLRNVATIWEADYGRGDKQITINTLSELFRDLLEESPVYIIVDALDECAPENRLKLMECLQPASENLSILVTSRLLDEFDFMSKDFKLFNIEAHPSDLDLFIEHQFATMPKLLRYAKEDPKLRDEVKKHVKEACDGMFLVASLQMRALASELTIGSLRKQLKDLPKQIDDTYELAISRINNLEEKHRDLALNTLAWIVNSSRPLLINELRHALSTIPDTNGFNIDDTIIYEDDIRNFCGGLVTIERFKVSLVHYTAQSYFQNKFPNFHCTIARVCIAYLSLRVLEQPDDEYNQMSYVEDNRLEFRSPQQLYRDYQAKGAYGPRQLSYGTKCLKFPLVEYAANSLGYHLRRLEMSSDAKDIVESLVELVSRRPKRNFLIRVLQYAYDRISGVEYGDTVDDDSDSWSSGTGGLQYFFREDVDSEKDSAIDYEDSDSFVSENTRITSRFGYAPLVRPPGTPERSQSLPRRSKPRWSQWSTSPDDAEQPQWAQSRDDTDQSQWPPSPDDAEQLQWGPSRDDAEQSQLLQSQGSTEHQITALHIAAFLGWPPLVTKLVENCENALHIDSIDTNGRTPLIIAAKAKNWDVVSILVKNNAAIDLMTTTGQHMLQHAAESAKREVAETMIAMALNSAVDGTGNLPSARSMALVIVTTNYCIMLVIRLLKLMLLLEFLSKRRILLHSAAKSTANSTITTLTYSGEYSTANSTTVVEELSVAHEERLKPEQRQNNLLLLQAATVGDIEVIESLLQKKKANISFGGSVFQTAIFLAVAFEHTTVVEKLLEFNGDINIPGIGGKTLLHIATSRNDIDMVKLLLRRKARVDIRDIHGETAFSANLNESHKEVIYVLRTAGADPNTKGPQGVTRLYEAAAGGRIDDVRFLLQLGVNPSIRTDFGWAPLHWAAGNGHLSCVRELMAHGVNLNTISDTSDTPLDMAIKKGQRKIAEILQNAGALTARQVLRNKGKKGYRNNDNDSDDSDDSYSDY